MLRLRPRWIAFGIAPLGLVALLLAFAVFPSRAHASAIPGDYYERLRVPKSASRDEIQKSYRRLARRSHPDVAKDAGAEERFKALGEAWEILEDADQRASYDRAAREASRFASRRAPAPTEYDPSRTLSDRAAGRLTLVKDELTGEPFLVQPSTGFFFETDANGTAYDPSRPLRFSGNPGDYRLVDYRVAARKAKAGEPAEADEASPSAPIRRREPVPEPPYAEPASPATDAIGLARYENLLGPAFVRAVIALDRRTRWLDVRADGHSLAQGEYLIGQELSPRPAGMKRAETGLTLREYKATAEAASPEAIARGLPYLGNRFIVTDVHEGLERSRAPDRLLAAYLAAMPAGGSVFAALADRRATVRVRGQAPISLGRWLAEEVTGLMVIRKAAPGNGPTSVLEIQREASRRMHIPRLEWMRTSEVDGQAIHEFAQSE